MLITLLELGTFVNAQQLQEKVANELAVEPWHKHCNKNVSKNIVTKLSMLCRLLCWTICDAQLLQ
jgi:hypothetical protein